jgi:DNA-binding response OmpR family regulator
MYRQHIARFSTTPCARLLPLDDEFGVACQGQYLLRMATVLLVEDDHVVRGAMLRSLADRGHAVHAVGTALDALRRVAAETPDLVVLDLGLPDLDGSDALRMLRGITDIPIIIATARDDEQTVVRLLRAGADDYMVKPFTGAHLDARITTVLRRVGRASRTTQPAVHEVGELRVDIGERSASLADQPLALTRKEFDLLAYLAARPGRVVSRRELLEEVWRQPSVGEDQTIDVHLYWLRRKLGESAAKPRYLRTVRGVGFRLVAPD